MEPAPLTAEARVASWRVFALVLLSASYFYQSSGHNEAARFDQMRSVMEHGEWWIDRFAVNTADTVRVGGHTYPNKAPGTTLLGLLPWGLARVAAIVLPLSEAQQLIVVTYALTILMSALPTALTSLLILRFLSRNGWTGASATLVGLGYGLGTIAFPWSTVFFGHQLSAFLAFGAFHLIWSCQGQAGGSRPRTIRLFLAGLLLGFLPVIEYPGAIASGLIGLYSLAAVGVRASLPLIAGAGFGLLPLPLYNQAVFGDPLALSYSFYKEGSLFPAHQQGLGGVSWPRLDVLKEITFRPRRGLFHANPWLVFALTAPFFMTRFRDLRRELILCTAVMVGFLLFNSGFGDSVIYWGGAFSFGPRHILIAVPFVVLLAALPMRVSSLAPLVGVPMVATVLLMLMVSAIDPRLPYEPTEPFLGFYLPLYSRGLFSTFPWSTFDDAALFGSPGAFNLGRAAGMPRDLEIVPLALVWAMAPIALFQASSRGARVARAMTGVLALAVGLWPALPGVVASRGQEGGLCQAISAGKTWPYFSDYALQAEPSENPVLLRAPSPSIPLTSEADPRVSGRLARVAVTFSGHFEPEAPGWYMFRMDVIGEAALYIDGLHRLKIEGPASFKRVQAAQVYLSKASHELVVRYMSDQPVRELNVFIGLGHAPASPLVTGLSSRWCG